MQLIDTHTHIYLPEFDNDRDEAVKRALDAGVVKMLMPNIDQDSFIPMLEAEKHYPGICIAMAGLHPTSVKEDYLLQLEKTEEFLNSRKFCAVGEIGIDLYWDKSHIREQVSAFKKQIEISIIKEMPAVIHSRNSFGEVFEALGEFRGSGMKGVFHAFTGTPQDAEKAVRLGFKLGIGGIVTFKNSGLDKTVKEYGPENIILETDSPYLAPVPFRGKRNESSYICIINKKVAEICGLSEEIVSSVTFSNSVKLFGLE